MSLMTIDHIEDYERRLAQQDAFWDRAIIDRPVVLMTVGRPNPAYPFPAAKTYASHRERWMDTERVVASAVASVMNTEYLGDALPSAWPNLGPELFSAFFGMEMEYSADTSWGVPNIRHWISADDLRISRENFYWKKLVEMTDALLAAGKGKFYVGLSDIHPGGDAVAAFRDPATLNVDLLLYPEEVRALLAHVNAEFRQVLDFFYGKLLGAGQAVTSWPGIVSTKKWYVPSNDFSCMISKEMFDDFFLPGIIEECRYLEASIYHLDGPDALRHLDSLLAIEELNAIQWVYGAGRGRASDWLRVYKRCQAAGKGIQMFVEADEVDCMIENLRPEGVWMGVSVPDKAAAEAVLKKVSKWR